MGRSSRRLLIIEPRVPDSPLVVNGGFKVSLLIRARSDAISEQLRRQYGGSGQVLSIRRGQANVFLLQTQDRGTTQLHDRWKDELLSLCTWANMVIRNAQLVGFKSGRTTQFTLFEGAGYRNLSRSFRNRRRDAVLFYGFARNRWRTDRKVIMFRLRPIDEPPQRAGPGLRAGLRRQ